MKVSLKFLSSCCRSDLPDFLGIVRSECIGRLMEDNHVTGYSSAFKDAIADLQDHAVLSTLSEPHSKLHREVVKYLAISEAYLRHTGKFGVVLT